MLNHMIEELMRDDPEEEQMYPTPVMKVLDYVYTYLFILLNGPRGSINRTARRVAAYIISLPYRFHIIERPDQMPEDDDIIVNYDFTPIGAENIKVIVAKRRFTTFYISDVTSLTNFIVRMVTMYLPPKWQELNIEEFIATLAGMLRPAVDVDLGDM